MIITKLNKAIDDVSYILDCLIAYRNIVEQGNNCNNCYNKNCEWKPKPGWQVRYNCPHYEKWRP